MNMPSSDCVALVTGTSSGIGAAIADSLLREGWTVLGLSRRQVDFGNPRYRHVQVDLGDLEQLSGVAQRELAPTINDDRWHRIGLVNNAGAIGALRPLEEVDPLKLARVFAVNAVAPIFLMGFVVRHALSTAWLRIVNLSTGAAGQPSPGLGDYGSSKAALRLAGMTLAAELGSDQRPGGARPNVAILSYSPGVVDTAMQEMARSPGRPWNQRFVDFHAQGQLQPPQAPALEVVSFLASDSQEPFVERRFAMA
jgi:NAD(P)-dependent dehydrogenase (short-subunit alcohol dehydrogenase family)